MGIFDKENHLNLAMAMLFVIVMILRPIAMARLADELEDKDGSTKVMPLYTTATVFGILSAAVMMFGDKVEAIKPFKMYATLGFAVLAFIMYFSATATLKKANASAGMYLSALFDFGSAAIIVAVLGLMVYDQYKASKATAAAAAFGHFYY